MEMSSLLYKLIIKSCYSIAEGLHNNECTDCKSCLAYIKLEDTHLIFKCLNSNKTTNKILIEN